MGSYVELNDTLQITSKQGFPPELDFKKHKNHPLTANDFKGKVFEFKNKEGIRIYPTPPVRAFLVQNIDGKWLYWGLIHVTEVIHDQVKKATSGKFKIVCIYTPEEMKQAHKLIDRNKKTDYFKTIK